MDPRNTTGQRDTSLYAQSGVTNDLENVGLPAMLSFVRQTLTLRERFGRPLEDVGYYANVVDIPGNDASDGFGLAVSCDGVGTKILIAEMMRSYRTIPQDCVAMNVNDILCVGAEPVSFLSYVGISDHDPEMLAELGRGFLDACREANVTIPGGETAQVGALLNGVPGALHFDLVGTAIGIVRKDRINFGRGLEEGDVLIGFASSGLHSNGYSLARTIAFAKQGWTVDTHLPELGETVGEALLRPTKLYVRPVVEMLRRGLNLKAINHITGGGFLNLLRVQSTVAFEILALPGRTATEHAPALPPIIPVLIDAGEIPVAEQYEVMNMGVGLVLTVPATEVEAVLAVAAETGHTAWRLGRVVASDRKEVRLPEVNLVGTDNGWFPLE